ncbi:hypothetical protein ACN24M_02800 [Streptomyces microflavus]
MRRTPPGRRTPGAHLSASGAPERRPGVRRAAQTAAVRGLCLGAWALALYVLFTMPAAD